MVFRVELRFVDESEFQKQGKWYILPQNPECEIDSTILFESDGSLDEEEYDSEEEFDEDSADSFSLRAMRATAITVTKPRHLQAAK